MGRPPANEGPPSTDVEGIRKRADEYRGLQTKLTERREETKIVTGGKTDWRRTCVEDHIDPVILADAVELMMKVEKYPKKTTREWRIFVGYLRGLGFFSKLERGLFDDFEDAIIAQSAERAA